MTPCCLRYSYPQTATGETPDIDLDSIHDFVFDDIDGIRCLEEVNIDTFMKNTTSTSTDEIRPMFHDQQVSQNHHLHGEERIPTKEPYVRTEKNHTQQRPEKYSTNERTSSSVESNCRPIPTREPVNKTKYDQTSKSCSFPTLEKQRAYKACMVPTIMTPIDNKSENDGDTNSELSEESLDDPLATPKLVLVRGETGGACGAGDVAVVASDTPSRRKPAKKKSRYKNHSHTCSTERSSPLRENEHYNFVPTSSSILNSSNGIKLPSTSNTSLNETILRPRHPPLQKIVGEVQAGIPITSTLAKNISRRSRNYLLEEVFNVS